MLMCRVLIVKLLPLKILLSCLNACKLQKLFIKMLQNLLIKNNRAYGNRAVHSSKKRGEATLSKIYFKIVKYDANIKQRYKDLLRYIMHLT